jgi:hypothetical protein
MGSCDIKSGSGIIIGSEMRRCRDTVTVMPWRGLRGSECMKGFALMLSMLFSSTTRLVCTSVDSLWAASLGKTALRNRQLERDLALVFRGAVDDASVTVTSGEEVEG